MTGQPPGPIGHDRARHDRSGSGRTTPPHVTPNDPEAPLRRFRAFHDALLAIKDALSRGDWTALLTQPVISGSVDQQLLHAVRTRLIAEIQIAQPDQAATAHAEIVDTGIADTGIADTGTGIDPGYIMAIVADEALLHDVVWPGQDGWAREPLQQVLYGVTDGGQQIVRAIDDLAKGHKQNHDDGVMTIKLALDLGYLHRQDSNAPAPSDPPAQRVFEIVFRPTNAVPAVTDDFMTGAVQPLTAQAAARLPEVRPWVLALGAIACGYLLIGWLLWRWQVADAVDAAARILATLHPVR